MYDEVRRWRQCDRASTVWVGMCGSRCPSVFLFERLGERVSRTSDKKLCPGQAGVPGHLCRCQGARLANLRIHDRFHGSLARGEGWRLTSQLYARLWSVFRHTC